MRIVKLAVFLLVAIFFASKLGAKEIIYNRPAVKNYAADYCGAEGSGTKYNFPEYTCFNGDKPECLADHPWLKYTDKTGQTKYKHVDCANFVSQCLINAKFDFKGLSNAQTIGKKGSKKAGTRGFPAVQDLLTTLQNSFCFEESLAGTILKSR